MDCPKVQGRCPSCGGDTLFLGHGGYVTCSLISCKAPGAVTDMLTNERCRFYGASSHLLEAFQRIASERARQEELRIQGRFKDTCASPISTHPRSKKVPILGEEFGEVCGAVLQAEGDASDRVGAEVFKEVLHVAAVATAWLESELASV